MKTEETPVTEEQSTKTEAEILVEKTNERLANWALTKMEKSEQEKVLSKYLLEGILEATSKGDHVEEIIVHNQIFELVAGILQSPNVPEDFEIKESAELEQFLAYTARIAIRSAATEQMIIPDYAGTIPEEVQFVRLITSMMRRQAFIEQWDRSIGFSQFLRSRNIPLPNPQDKGLLMYISFFNEMIQEKASKIQMATSTPNNLTFPK